jgi:hypothetical protein
MKSIYLLKDFCGDSANTIITTEDCIADNLINNGIGRLATNRDYLVKPITTIKNIVSKAFNSSPRTK